ncbi:MAG: PQQ-binding-like beta-propeller repeat protein, partial [Verrucomicrobiota bacterium]
MPAWSHTAPMGAPRGQNQATVRANAFRPFIAGRDIYTRQSYGPRPSHMARIDADTGQIRWIVNPGGNNPGYPHGDPVVSGRFVYAMQRDRNGVDLVCLDAETGKQIWQNALRPVDEFNTTFRGHVNQTVFGSPVTVHEGAIFAMPEAGIVSKSDIRDGHMQWVYEYPSVAPKAQRIGRWGSAPIVHGEHLICLPRDSDTIFCLDLRTGQRLWENAFVVPRYPLGMAGDRLIVLGSSSLAGIEAANGEIAWAVPFTEHVVGWPQRVGDSIFLGSTTELIRFDAHTGVERERRAWPEGDFDVRNFGVHGGRLYIVTDEPCRQQGPLATELVEAPSKSPLPSRPVWKLSRRNPTMFVPPQEGASHGKVLLYIEKTRTLECIDTAGQGRIAWRKMLDADFNGLSFQNGKAIVYHPGPSGLTEWIALDLPTGKPIWKSILPEGMRLYKRQGPILLLNEHYKVAAADLGTGEIMWNRIIKHFGVGYGGAQMDIVGDRLQIVHHQERGDWLNWVTGDPVKGDPLELTEKWLTTDPENETATRPWLQPGALFGQKACYVSVKRSGDGVNRLYRMNYADRSIKMIRENALPHAYHPPYIMIDDRSKANEGNPEIIIFDETDPDFQR